EPNWIGRDPTCEVPLAVQSVSRRHVALQRLPEGIQVVDGSMNGTWVEDLHLKRAARTYLQRQVRLRVGTVDIRVSIPIRLDERHADQAAELVAPRGRADDGPRRGDGDRSKADVE